LRKTIQPGPGFRQPVADRRHEGEQRKGQSQADAKAGKNDQRLIGGNMKSWRPKAAANEWPVQGVGDKACERAGPEKDPAGGRLSLSACYPRN